MVGDYFEGVWVSFVKDRRSISFWRFPSFLGEQVDDRKYKIWWISLCLASAPSSFKNIKVDHNYRLSRLFAVPLKYSSGFHLLRPLRWRILQTLISLNVAYNCFITCVGYHSQNWARKSWESLIHNKRHIWKLDTRHLTESYEEVMKVNVSSIKW